MLRPGFVHPSGRLHAYPERRAPFTGSAVTAERGKNIADDLISQPSMQHSQCRVYLSTAGVGRRRLDRTSGRDTADVHDVEHALPLEAYVRSGKMLKMFWSVSSRSQGNLVACRLCARRPQRVCSAAKNTRRAIAAASKQSTSVRRTYGLRSPCRTLPGETRDGRRPAHPRTLPSCGLPRIRYWKTTLHSRNRVN